MFLLLTCRNGETVAQTMISTAPSPSSWGWPSTARSQDLSSTININQIPNAPEWRVWTVLHLQIPSRAQHAARTILIIWVTQQFQT